MNTTTLRRLSLAFVILVALFGVQPGPNPARAGIPAASDVRPGTVLVKFEPPASAATASTLLSRHNAVRIDTLPTGVQVLRVPEGTERAVSRALASAPGVRFAEPDVRVHAAGRIALAEVAETIPDDIYYDPNQWAHSVIRSEWAWDLTTGSDDVIIAIIDSGIDLGHPDLVQKLVPGHSFLSSDASSPPQEDDNPIDLHGHGTHVAGIAAAVTNNNIGVAGMSWGARLMPVRVLGWDGGGWTSDVARGIIWAYQHGADVINLSLGSADSETMQDAINSAHAAGTLIVAAMGNDHTGIPSYPAAHANVLAVSATDQGDDLADYSNYGPHCDVAAPGGEFSGGDAGQGIFSTLPTYPDFYLYTQHGYPTDYFYLEGTSQATPFVSGLAALIWSLDDTLTPDEVQDIIESTAADLGTPGPDDDYGHGRIDARAALEAAYPLAAPALAPITGATDGAYRVDWSDVPVADHYILQESADGEFSTPNLFAPAASEFDVADQSPGFWYYRVRAVNPYHTGPWSNVVTAGVAPDAPTLTLTPLSTPDAYRLNWTAPEGAQTYRLFEAQDPGFADATLRYLGISQTLTITGQDTGTWYYHVEAGSEVGFGAPSNAVSHAVPKAPIARPAIDTIDNEDGNGDYEVTWSETPSAEYLLEESPSPYFEAPVQVYSGPSPTHTVTAQPVGRWYYRVRARVGSDLSPWSTLQSVLVPAYIYLPLILH